MNDWKYRQDMTAAENVADIIVNTLFEAGYFRQDELEDALFFGKLKLSEIIYQYGKDIRETCKAAYKQAIAERIEELEP